MRAALVAEYRKLVSTRLWWVLLLVMVGYLAFIGAVLAVSFTVDQPEGGGGPVLTGPDAATSVYSAVNAVGYVFPLLVGSLSVTAEFRHRTVTQSLLAEPRRGVLLAAKLLAAVPVGLLLGVAGVGATVAAGAPLLAWAGDGAYLTSGPVLQVLLWGALVTALWAVVGTALGGVLSNQVAAIVVILAFTQFVEPVARLALAAVDPLAGVARFLPGAAADAAVGASLFGEIGGGGADLLPRWGGVLVMLAYAAALAVIARATTLRRDVG